MTRRYSIGLFSFGLFAQFFNGGISNLNFADAETPGGTVDGVNTIFTLAFTPSPGISLQFVRNGLVQSPGGIDFDLSGNTVTFIPAATPQVDDILRAWYRH
jgi:hypothetical protein